MKQWKKVEKTSQHNIGPNSPEFIETDDSSDEEGEPRKGQAVGKKLKRPHTVKKNQSHLNLLKPMTQTMKKKKNLKNHQGQAMKKMLLQRPHSLKKDQKPKGPLIQAQMTQVPKMNKNLQ